MPRWRRHKHRRSASMSGSDESKSSGGQDNPGYARSPPGLSTSVDNILENIVKFPVIYEEAKSWLK